MHTQSWVVLHPEFLPYPIDPSGRWGSFCYFDPLSGFVFFVLFLKTFLPAVCFPAITNGNDRVNENIGP